MTLTLHNLPARHGRRRRRIGRGHGSGRGTYAGRGMKGQRARTGGRKGALRRALAQTMRRLPKQRGFTPVQKKYLVVSLSALEQLFQSGERVTPLNLLQHGVNPRGFRGIKILGTGRLTKPLHVSAHAFSSSAARAITEAGGSVTRLERHGK